MIHVDEDFPIHRMAWYGMIHRDIIHWTLNVER